MAEEPSYSGALDRKIRDTIERLAAAQAELESLMAGQIDAVVAPTGGPILLRDAQAALAASLERYHRLVTHMAALVFELAPDGTVLFVNDAATAMTGYTPGDLIGNNWWEILCPGPLCAQRDTLTARLRAGDVRDYALTLQSRSNRELILEVNSANRHGDGQLLTIVGFGIDVTSRKRAESALRHLQQQFEAVAENAPDLIARVDRAQRCLYANQAVAKAIGIPAGKLIDRTCRDLDLPEQDTERWARHVALAFETGREVTLEVRLGTGQGERHFETRIVPEREVDGRINTVLAVGRDITERERAAARMSHTAHHDALTGIPNRLLFMANLDSAVERARRRNTQIAVLFLDLDRFKVINDTLGHGVGDQLLQAVAARLRTCVRAEDTIARLGGDEFTVILSEIAHAEDAALVASNIVRQVALPMRIAGHEVVTATSVGISVFPNDASSSADLLRTADMALYKAKESGRNNYQFFTQDLTQLAMAHLAVEQGLHRALAQREFVIHYQPLVALRDGTLVGAEALVRWQHPEKGLLLPAEFLDIAEHTGLIEPIGEWVLRAACRQALAWQAEGLPRLRMSINVSTRQILRDGLLAALRQILRERDSLSSGLQLDLEITENVLQSIEGHVDVLRQIKSLGVTLAIDDFGTGYSSLSRLKRLPIDTVKIDRSFIDDIPSAPDDNAIPRAIVAMAHSLNLKVVAEGIENGDQLGFLRDLHCEEGQGYLFSEPVPPEAMRDILARRKRIDAVP